jgi:Uma2 family endonuclease
MFDDKQLAIKGSKALANPLMLLARNGPVLIRSKISKAQFHQFLLHHEEVKIERDKHGVITIHPPMTLKSAYYEGEAFFALKQWSKTNKLGRAFSPSAAFDLPDGSTYKADGAWISMKKLKQLTPEQADGISFLVPEFVMEVRSKSDSLAKLKKKMTEAWMANGAQLAWLIDPRSQKAWIYRAGLPVEEVPNFDATLSGEALLPGFELDLRDLK